MGDRKCKAERGKSQKWDEADGVKEEAGSRNKVQRIKKSDQLFVEMYVSSVLCLQQRKTTLIVSRAQHKAITECSNRLAGRPAGRHTEGRASCTQRPPPHSLLLLLLLLQELQAFKRRRRRRPVGRRIASNRSACRAYLLQHSPNNRARAVSQ